MRLVVFSLFMSYVSGRWCWGVYDIKVLARFSRVLKGWLLQAHLSKYMKPIT